MFLLVILAGTMMLGLVMLVGRLAAGAVNLLFGRPAGPSRLATKQAKIQELLVLVEQIEQEQREHVARMQAMDVEHNRIMAERFRNEM